MKKVLYSGWLTKSPPEKKAHGPLKIFKSKWRKRFFVLSKIHDANVLPGACPAQLEYFDNEKQANRKGSINLNNCEQIFVHFESKRYNHIFVVKTTDQGQQRSYYLAADSEEAMERWVEKLLAVLSLQDQGLLPVDLRFTPSPRTNIPPRILPLGSRHQVSVPVSSGDSSGLLSPLSEMQDPFDSPPRSGNQQSPEEYFPLNECSSGGTPTPTPRGVTDNPVKVVTVSIRNQPRHASSSSQRSDRDSEVYKVPPLQCSGVYQEPSSDSTYDYPASSEREWQRDSNYDYPPPLNSLQNEGGRDLTYDYPPSVPQRSCGSDSEQPLWECESKQVPEVVGDTYDLLPPRPLVVPPRNSIGVAVGDPHSVYDIPASCRTSNLLPPPPKAHPVAPKVHRYINAASAVVSSTQRDAVSNDDSVYLAMSSVESGNNVYMPMSEMDDFDGHCSRMMSAGQSSANRVSDKPPKAPVTLPRSFAKEGGGFSIVNHVDGFVDSCHATQRTRSFIRHIPSPSSDNVILPQKIKMIQSSSSSEDEDETNSETNSVKEYLNLQNSVGPGVESLIQQGKPVVQYLDLDLEASAERSSIGPSSSDTQNKIEYNEIDVERTTALFNAKLMLEKERKGSDKSES